ncbi:MAG: class I SAM-dependent methyltransferase [Rhodospirillales bacterium]|nr:MAG: class I SAM-dependent methyltransferase [Rhodospirillales bacterium]
MIAPDFTDVTELPAAPISRAQLERLVQRYVWAAGRCAGKDVLDVACGAGAGLGMFLARARSVVAGDIDETILSVARGHYGDRVQLRRCDAQELPFADASFDVVVMFEALYYLAAPQRFVAESRRVLRPGGEVLLCTANKSLLGFTPSPHSVAYHDPPELAALFAAAGFNMTFLGGAPVAEAGLRRRALAPVKALAGKLGLMPGTMAGKERLRRLVFGKLAPMPAELRGDEAPYVAPVPIPADRPDTAYQVLYCVATPVG